jgi:hypothetical protein
MSAERGLGGRAFARGFVSGATVPRSAGEAERETRVPWLDGPGGSGTAPGARRRRRLPPRCRSSTCPTARQYAWSLRAQEVVANLVHEAPVGFRLRGHDRIVIARAGFSPRDHHPWQSGIRLREPS